VYRFFTTGNLYISAILTAYHGIIRLVLNYGKMDGISLNTEKYLVLDQKQSEGGPRGHTFGHRSFSRSALFIKEHSLPVPEHIAPVTMIAWKVTDSFKKRKVLSAHPVLIIP
jgi:hypothetical protein